MHVALENPSDDPDSKAPAGIAVQRWDGMPSGLRDYPTTSKMINERVDAMVDEYAKKKTASK